MDYQNAEFYKLNKNNTDLVYNFADEIITYRKEEIDGKHIIMEYRRKNDKKGATRRIVPSYEMSVEDFDVWKKRLTDEAKEEVNKDQRETRHNVSIENLLETDLVSTDIFEDEERQKEEDRAYERKRAYGMELLSKLTPTQRRRYYKKTALGMTETAIAEQEGVSQPSVFDSLEAAQTKLEKLQKKG